MGVTNRKSPLSSSVCVFLSSGFKSSGIEWLGHVPGSTTGMEQATTLTAGRFNKWGGYYAPPGKQWDRGDLAKPDRAKK